MPPHTTAASATLNTGHHCTSMKSTTAPDMNPVAVSPVNGLTSPTLVSRSMMLPSAPPMTMPMSTSCTFDSTLRATSASTTTMPSATVPMIAPAPEPFEKAIPVLNASLNRSDPMRSTTSPVDSRSSAHRLDSWSSAITATATPSTIAQRRPDAMCPVLLVSVASVMESSAAVVSGSCGS